MSTPVVGITSYLDQAQSGVWDLEAVFLPWRYGEGFVAAGAAVVILPPQPALPDAVAAVLDGIDALVLTGGADLDATRYGKAPHPNNDNPKPERDAWELGLVEEAMRRDMPVLGICRGAQVLNVARGGSLIQHVPEVVGNKAHEGEEDRFGHVSINTVPDSKVAGLIVSGAEVPVYHHQALDALGEGLIVSAQSEYGIVEAVEDPDAPFCVGVQWHPEQDSRPEVFDALVAAARAYRSRIHIVEFGESGPPSSS